VTTLGHTLPELEVLLRRTEELNVLRIGSGGVRVEAAGPLVVPRLRPLTDDAYARFDSAIRAINDTLSVLFLFLLSFELTLKFGLALSFGFSLSLGLTLSSGFRHHLDSRLWIELQARALNFAYDRHENEERTDPEYSELRPVTPIPRGSQPFTNPSTRLVGTIHSIETVLAYRHLKNAMFLSYSPRSPSNLHLPHAARRAHCPKIFLSVCSLAYS
jgi:hypothetical protein